MKLRIISFLLFSVLVSTSLHSIPTAPITKPLTKLFSKQAKEVVEIADGSIAKLSRNFSDDFSRINKFNNKLFKSFSNDPSINYTYMLDERFATLDSKTQTRFLNAWKSKASTNFDDMQKAYIELTSISQNETFDSFVAKLGKIEATVIAGLFGITFVSMDAEAAKGARVDTNKLPIGIKPDDLDMALDSINKKKLIHLACLQAFEISNFRDQKTYPQFQSQVPACPVTQPDQQSLENYFVVRTNK